MKKYIDYAIAFAGCCIAGIGGLLLLGMLNTCNAQTTMYTQHTDGSGVYTLSSVADGLLYGGRNPQGHAWLEDGFYDVTVHPFAGELYSYTIAGIELLYDCRIEVVGGGVFVTSVPCTTDITGDGFNGTLDLLALLAVYGEWCE